MRQLKGTSADATHQVVRTLRQGIRYAAKYRFGNVLFMALKRRNERIKQG